MTEISTLNNPPPTACWAFTGSTFATVAHLHLNAISPTNQLSFWQKIEYSPYIFATIDETVRMMEKKIF